MTNPQSPQILPVAGELARESTKEEAGMPDSDLAEATRDSDGVLVGEDDLEADKRNSGA